MTVTTPLRPPRPRRPVSPDPVERTDPEALIEEARQRARRRRRIYGAAAAALALLGVSLAVVFGRPEQSQSASSEPPPLPIPADPDDAATIVAHWGKIHVGYVLVYADGRVILYPDLHAVFPLPLDRQADWNPYFATIFERRLTADGLDLVRSGALQASAFLPDERVVGAAGTESKTSLPAGLWADPAFKPYEPSKYAVCPPSGNRPRLPATVRALLRGKERTYHPNRPFDSGRSGPVECFEVSREEASILRTRFVDPVGLLPHGEWVFWAG